MKKITMMMSALALFVSANVSAQLLTEDFEDTKADSRWFPSTIGDISPLDFAAKYTDLGITAPTNGGEYCAKLQANVKAGDDGKGSSNFLGISPKADFTGAYTLTFDAYMFYEGTSGTSETMLWGVGHEGSTPETEGLRLGLFADNGSGKDVRLYKAGDHKSYDAATTEYSYAGADVNGLDNEQNGNLDAPNISYYQQAYGNTFETNPGNQWLSIKAEVTTSATIFYVNDMEFARFNEAPTSGTILIGYVDLFTGSVNTTSYMLVDNVKVVASSLGINERELSNVSVYPNPASGVVNVSVEGNAKFQLFNISGQSVMSRDISGTTSIDVSSLNSGIYFSRITGESGAVKTIKLQIK